MMAHRVTLIPGDGTGPELTEATRRVLEATGVEFDWDVQEAGADVMEAHDGNPLPEETLASIRDTGVALKGPITTPIGTGFRSVNVALRHELNLYACLRPCKTYPGVRTRYEAVDVVIVRENTEDLYAGIEFESGKRGRAGADRDARPAAAEAAEPEVRPLDQADEPGSLGADHSLRVRLRARAGPRRRPRRHEGEHHEAHGRALPRGLPARRRRVRRHRAAGESRRRHLHGSRAAARGIRRPRAAQPLRRHRLRPGCRASSAASASRPARTSARTPPSSRRRTALHPSTGARTRSTRSP